LGDATRAPLLALALLIEKDEAMSDQQRRLIAADTTARRQRKRRIPIANSSVPAARRSPATARPRDAGAAQAAAADL